MTRSCCTGSSYWGCMRSAWRPNVAKRAMATIGRSRLMISTAATCRVRGKRSCCRRTDRRRTSNDATACSASTQGIAVPPPAWLTRQMSEPEESGNIDATIETSAIDIDGDGVADIVTEVTTLVVDVDGDGVPDAVEQTTVTGYDLDGDGVPDAVDRTTVTAYDLDGDGVPDVITSSAVTAVDANGDGSIDEDEISVDEVVAVREDLVE